MGKVVQNPVFRAAVGVGLFFVPGMQMMSANMALAFKAIGANLVLGEAARLLGPKPPKRTINPQTVTVRGSNLPGSIIYGETRTGGMLYIPAPGVSGDGNKYIHYIIVLAAHELDHIGHIWLDNEFISSDDIDVDGNVTAGDYAGKVLIEKFLGTDAQTASTVLTAAIPNWTADFRGRGVAYLHLRFERDDELFPGGPPQNIFARVRGRKVYDPRSGTTAYSDNPALCLRDYLTTYAGATVNDTYVTAAANICDETVTVPLTTQKRYRCAGILSSGDEPADNVSKILSAMSGVATFAKGAFRIYAGAYDAPTKTIDGSWLAGDVTLQATTPGAKLYNIVRGEYIDPGRNYQVSEFEPQTFPAYETIDGRELELAMSLPFTFHEYQAQRQGWQMLLQSRGQRVLELPLNLKALDLSVWDTVNVSLPRLGVNEVYRVMSWRYSDGASIVVTLREDSVGFYQEPTYINATTAEQFATLRQSPESPNNLTIVPGTGGNQITWTNPPARQFDQIEIWRSPNSGFADAVLVATVRASSYFDIIAGDSTPSYWIRARNASGQYSEYIPNTTDSGSSGGTSPPPPPSGDLFVVVSATSVFRAVDDTENATTATVTCTASGGTGPYTYAWTRVSGSTDITALTPAVAATRFYAAADSSTSKSSIWKCTVTDSASPENVVDSPNVTVSILWESRDWSGGEIPP